MAINPSNLTVSAVAVATGAATLLCAANGRRSSLLIQNLGPNAIKLGPSTVTALTGYSLAAGATIAFSREGEDSTAGEAFYAIADTANQVAPADTRVFEGRA
jgi:hypothetical protein